MHSYIKSKSRIIQSSYPTLTTSKVPAANCATFFAKVIATCAIWLNFFSALCLRSPVSIDLFHSAIGLASICTEDFIALGVRVHPMRGMERSLQSTFPRIQVALRRSMHDFQDPMDADLMQWAGCSKMSSGQMEALVRIRGDAVEVRAPSSGGYALKISIFYRSKCEVQQKEPPRVFTFWKTSSIW